MFKKQIHSFYLIGLLFSIDLIGSQYDENQKNIRPIFKNSQKFIQIKDQKNITPVLKELQRSGPKKYRYNNIESAGTLENRKKLVLSKKAKSALSLVKSLNLDEQRVVVKEGLSSIKGSFNFN